MNIKTQSTPQTFFVAVRSDGNGGEYYDMDTLAETPNLAAHHAGTAESNARVGKRSYWIEHRVTRFAALEIKEVTNQSPQ